MIYKKILSFLKKNYLLIISAFIVSLVSILPYIIPVIQLGDNYRGIPFIYQANEDAYLARIREVVDGHGSVGSAFFYEYKDWNPVVPSVGEYLYALPSIIFRLPLLDVLIASKFFLPAILFILVYLLIYKLSNNPDLLSTKLNAIFGGFLVTLGYDLIDYRYIIKIFNGQTISTTLSVWTRPINPIIGAVLIFSFLLLVLSIIKSRRKFLFIPAGLVWALTIGYVFSWTFILAVLLLLILFYLYKKDYFLIKNFLFTLLVWFIVTLPYWYGLFRSFASSGGRELAAKSGMVYTHAPVFNKVLFVGSILFLLLSLYFKYYKKEKNKDDLWWYFSLILIITGWVVFNQQVITGRTIWYHHYVQYTIPTLMVVGMLALNNWIKPYLFKIWAGVIAIFAISIFVYNILILQTVYNIQNDFRKLQNFAPVFAWINNNTDKDCVLLNQDAVDVKLDTLIPAFTHCNVYAPSWVFDGVPEERIWHNYLVMLRLRNVDPVNVEEYLQNNKTEVLSYFFVDWDQLFHGTGEEYIQEKIKELTIAYRDFVKKDFREELQKYKLDYILFVGEPELRVKEQLPDIKLLYNSGEYFIYKF